MAEGIGFTSDLHSLLRPSTLGTLRAWYDASQESFADGDAVGTFTDRSGNARHLTQATGANKPLYKLNAANGRPALLFDGTNDTLATASFGATTQPTTIYIVARRTGDTSTTRVMTTGIGISNRLILFSELTTGKPAFYAGTTIAGLEDMGSDWFLISAVFNGASSKLLLNDVQTASGNAGAQTLTGITMGSDYTGAISFWAGYIAEALYFDGAVSTDNDYTIRRALHAKYKIPYFDPASITGLRSIFMADALRLRDGESVSEWEDLIGGYDLLQATGANQPICKKDIYNHRACVRFDGSNDYLQSAAFTVLAQQGTVIIVGKHDNAAALHVFFDGIGASNRHILYAAITTGFLTASAGTALASATDIGTSLAALGAIYNSASGAIYKNSTSIATGNVNTQKLTGYTLGAAYDGSSPLDGDISEVLVYEVPLSTTNLLKVIGAARTKYAI